MPAWSDYQERVAELFRALGCSAEVEKTICGVRSEHDVDVWLTFNRFGLDVHWIIECKLWASPVKKQHVLTLRGVIEDVGADRGIMISEKGFQAGAFAAARGTNIKLTSLAELRATNADTLRSLRIDGLLARAKTVQKQFFEDKSTSSSLDEAERTALGELVILTHELESLHGGTLPSYYPMRSMDGCLRFLGGDVDPDVLLDEITNHLAWISRLRCQPGA